MRNALIAAAAALAAAPASAATGVACPSPKGRVVAADARGRLYSVHDLGGLAYYGCLRGERRRTLLEVDADETYVTTPRLASPFAARISSTC